MKHSMNIENTPIYQRQIIFFANDIEVNSLYLSNDGKALLSKDEVKIIPISQGEQFLNSFQILGGIQPYNHMILVLSPTSPDKYAEVTDSAAYFSLEKLTKILRLCQLLGAKSVTIDDIFKEKDTSTTKTKSEIKAQIQGIEGSLETESKALTELNKYIGYTASFSGGKGNYEMAKSFLSKSKLGCDLFLSNLVDMRDPEFLDNEILNISQKITLYSRSDKMFKLLATLQLPIGGGKFEINTQTVSEKDYTLEIKINF